MISISSIQFHTNIFSMKKRDAIEKIKTNPYIEDVIIQRKLPNIIEISVKERYKKFNVEFLNGYAYINNQGYILEISEQRVSECPIIKGISTEETQIVEGYRLNTQDLERLGIVIQIMDICKNYELDTKITSIDITNRTNYIIYMEEEKKFIHLGDESNLSNKMLYVVAILEQTKEQEGQIFVNGNLNSGFQAYFKPKI